jgi:hypothetical protein
MKHLKILGSLLIAYALNSCSLANDASPDTLPPETQNGAETFGCLVNGKLFVPKGDSNFQTLSKDYDGGLTIVAIYATNGKWDTTIGIGHQSINGVGKYNDSKLRYFRYSNSIAGGYGNQIMPLKTSLNITKFERGEDKKNNLKWLIISGTFEAILLGDQNPLDTIRITEGRFDVKFN